jgi:hypothetical protein
MRSSGPRSMAHAHRGYAPEPDRGTRHSESMWFGQRERQSGARAEHGRAASAGQRSSRPPLAHLRPDGGGALDRSTVHPCPPLVSEISWLSFSERVLEPAGQTSPDQGGSSSSASFPRTQGSTTCVSPPCGAWSTRASCSHKMVYGEPKKVLKDHEWCGPAQRFGGLAAPAARERRHLHHRREKAAAEHRPFMQVLRRRGRGWCRSSWTPCPSSLPAQRASLAVGSPASGGGRPTRAGQCRRSCRFWCCPRSASAAVIMLDVIRSGLRTCSPLISNRRGLRIKLTRRGDRDRRRVTMSWSKRFRSR